MFVIDSNDVAKMILTRDEILSEIERGRLKINPFYETSLGEISYDLSLGNEFVFIQPSRTAVIDVTNLSSLKCERILSDYIILQPHDFVLARSQEWIELPTDIVAMVSGKSSLARLGLEVETAYVIAPGHAGYIILEISNRNRVAIKLKKGMLIAQLIFFRLSKPVRRYIDIGQFGIQKEISLPKKLKFVST